jgi:hypothetical protein
MSCDQPLEFEVNISSSVRALHRPAAPAPRRAWCCRLFCRCPAARWSCAQSCTAGRRTSHTACACRRRSRPRPACPTAPRPASAGTRPRSRRAPGAQSPPCSRCPHMSQRARWLVRTLPSASVAWHRAVLVYCMQRSEEPSTTCEQKDQATLHHVVANLHMKAFGLTAFEVAKNVQRVRTSPTRRRAADWRQPPGCTPLRRRYLRCRRRPELPQTSALAGPLHRPCLRNEQMLI